ncbi:helix-hairpin-helix domain-containing protein [soil metagenome]
MPERKLIIFYLLIYAFLSGQVYAQNYPLRDINIQLFIEELFSVQDEDINYEELYETLLLLYQNPLNLNRATRSELQSLFILSELQLNNFFNHIDQFGNLISIYELQAIPEFDLITIHKVAPFVIVLDPGLQYDPRPLWQRIFTERNNMFILRYDRTLEEKRGYSPAIPNAAGIMPSRYLGSPDRIYARFRVSHPKDFSLGFTMEKDAGEQFIFDRSTNRFGMDFYSYHFMLQNKGRLRSLIIGDYQIQIGQSLLLGAGFIVGKGAETINTIRRSSVGIRPYTSVVETGFFRGIAATVEAGNFLITSFYSNVQQDGNIAEMDTSSSALPMVSSIYTSGYHRTPNEIRAKNQINEQVAGTNILYKSRNRKFESGFTLMGTSWDVELRRTPRKYNQFEFQGSQNLNSGLHFSFNWQNFNFFGEGAISKSGGKGLVAGFISSLSPAIEMSMLLRNYDRNFHSIFGRAFGENSRNINEEGIYWGMKFKPHHKIYITTFYDRFRFPWLKFRVDAPSDGSEFLTRFNYLPNRKVILYAQYREKNRGINVPFENLNIIESGTLRNFILNLDYSAVRYLFLRSRIQGSSYSLGDSFTTGLVILQDFNFEWSRLAISTRLAIFDTDNFENRQYVYEKDVLYAFSIPALNGLGTRHYILLQYKMSRNMQFWLRFARTNFRDREFIGSGLERIEGNQRTDLKMQVLIRL